MAWFSNFYKKYSKYYSVLTNGMDSNEPRWRVPLTIWFLLFFVGMLYFLDVFQIEEFYTITRIPSKQNMGLRESREGFLIKTKGCRIPHMNPMDKTIIEFIKPAGPIVCNNGTPPLFDFNRTSIFLLNSSLPFYNLTDSSELKCCYEEVKRRNPKKTESDQKFTIGPSCIHFNDSVNIEEEYILVQCKYNNTKIYTDLFWFVPSKVKKLILSDFERPRLNVLVIGLDAVSRLNLYRQMPKTVKYLKDIGAVELLGYNKVGDNTFPNLMPVLTGMYEGELKNSCWVESGHFDKCTYIWDEYKNLGYVTSFGEDSSWMGIFNYVRKGFRYQPTDYAYGYFNRIAEQKIGNAHDMNVEQCIGSREVYRDLLNYIIALTKRLVEDGSPFFGFYWGASLSHDHLNKPSIGDDVYLEFFRFFEESGILKNTALIFMSDHGIRWGGIRQTYQGKMEERLPFVYLKVPKNFGVKHSKALYNLKENSYKLTTPFDLHETLTDLLYINQITNDFIDQRNVSNKRGISLFSRIPDTRTCASATIDSHWCTCQESYEVPNNDTTVITIAKFIVKHMNRILKGNAQCATLNLDEVLNARLMTHGDHIVKEKKTEAHDYMITLRTSPGGGVFESTVRSYKNKMNEIMGTISRLNLYGQQSKCITDFHLKLYCYCTGIF